MLSAATVAERAEQVAKEVRAYLPVTPLVRFEAFGEEIGAEVLVKCEHHQKTGSFKARGALAKLLMLTPEQRDRGIVTASTGNHGLGVANALHLLGGRGIVFMPENAAPGKVAALRRYGLELRADGTDAGVREAAARAYAAENDLVYVSPYNDPDVIVGQATIAVEMLEQLGGEKLDAVFVAVGGGGLISGVASVLKRALPDLRVYGVQPTVDAAMAASVDAGEIVDVEGGETLSDGTAGNVEPGAITFELVRELVDEWVLVDEPDIRATLRQVIDSEHQLVEGSAAMALAAVRLRRDQLQGQRVTVVSCGGNISADTLRAALGS